MKKKYLIILVLFSFVACTTTMTSRILHQSFESSAEKKKILDAINYVLVENGFDIKMVNESFGIISTEWRPISRGADTAASILSAIASSGPARQYSSVFMIQAQIMENGYKLIPKMKSIQKTSGLWGTSQSDTVYYPEKNSNEAKIAIKLIEEINSLLGIPNDYYWEEKVITVGGEKE